LVALNYSERLTFAGDSLVLWDLAGGREKHVLESGTKARAWSFSPDGKSLVAGYPDGKLDFWDVSTGKVRSTASAWPDVEIRGLAYSSDGRFLVIEPSESDAKGAKIWDVKANREDSAIAGDDDLDMPTYSPDGRYIAAMRRNRIVLWDAATKDVKYVLTGGSLRALACFAFSADSTMVAAGTTYTVRPLKNARVLVWKLSELK
jgi:WD40 repeat protein